jgi:hypothetical protein
MIDGDFAKNILDDARKSKEKMNESIHLFQSFLNAKESADPSIYYLARHRLQDGQALLDAALSEAKKFLGPQPDYAPEEIKEQRRERLRASHVIVESQTMDGLEAELLADEYLKSFMNPDKVISYVRETGTYQTAEKRKIQNIKVRMVIDELTALRTEARAWQQRAVEKIQSK